MLTKLDELYLPHHCYLERTDECYFLGEYTARRGFLYSATNSLIFNLKKKMDRRGRPEWVYKGRAIQNAAEQLRESLNHDFLNNATFVPVPPSKIRGDCLYDDRMTQVLRLLGPNIDVRELVCQRESMADAHSSDDRPSPSQLYANYEIDEELVEPQPRQIAIVDDVLTTGAHFKAMQRILRETYQGVPIAGFFIARRDPDTDPA
jgi:hypothetical protein